MTDGMSAQQAITLYGCFDQHGIRCWIMGGWGVDALLGRVTRVHKDLDLLMQLRDLPDYAEIVRSLGFDRKLEWSENRPTDIDGKRFDTAFVDAHPDGREIDVHVIYVDDQGDVVQLHGDPWPLPTATLFGMGRVTDTDVRCVSRAAQLAMHSQYDLPQEHREDLRLLQGMP